MNVSLYHHHSWHSRGYVVLRRSEWLGDGPAGRITEQLAAWAMQVATLPAGSHDRPPFGPFHSYERVARGEVRLSRTEAFVDHHLGLDAFLRGDASPVERLVAGLAREPVALYKDKINYKFPGSGGYVPHQDGYQRLGVPRYVSPRQRGFIAFVAMIAIDDATVANGCPHVAPKTWARKSGWLELRHACEYASNGTTMEDGDGGGADEYVPIEMAPGDILVYDNFMPHMSGPNLSDGPRRALFAIYHGAASTPRDLRTEYYVSEARDRRNRDGGRFVAAANVYHTGAPAWPSWSGLRSQDEPVGTFVGSM